MTSNQEILSDLIKSELDLIEIIYSVDPNTSFRIIYGSYNLEGLIEIGVKTVIVDNFEEVKESVYQANNNLFPIQVDVLMKYNALDLEALEIEMEGIINDLSKAFGKDLKKLGKRLKPYTVIPYGTIQLITVCRVSLIEYSV